MSELLPIAYLNGQFLPLADARVSPLDRGFLFGEGIYETLQVVRGQPLKMDAHFERLAASCAAIDLANPLAGDAGPQIVTRLVADNGAGNMNVYLQITRGADSAPRNHIFPEHTTPTVFAMCASADDRDPDIARRGVAAVTRPDTRWSRCDIKSTSLIANVLLREDARVHGAAEAILLRDGVVTEGAASTVVIVKNGRIVTTRPGQHILPGTTLDLIRRVLAEEGIDIIEADISESALREADEVWVCASTRDALPVCLLDGQPVGSGRPGPMWQRLDALYQAFKDTLST